MTVPFPWRNLRSVMLVILQVAIVASMLRSCAKAEDSILASSTWLPTLIVVGSLLIWPIARAIVLFFDPEESDGGKVCLRCRRRDLRPLTRSGGGIFQPALGYRCACCWTWFRVLDSGALIEEARWRIEPLDPRGINFLDESGTPAEIRFLDGPENS